MSLDVDVKEERPPYTQVEKIAYSNIRESSNPSGSAGIILVLVLVLLIIAGMML